MKRIAIHLMATVLTSFIVIEIQAQTPQLKKEINDSESVYIQEVFDKISVSDQLYRGPISKGTLDRNLLAKIDSVFDTHGLEAGMAYQKELDLKMPASVKDSLWQLQHRIDYENHLLLRGIFETYGFIPKEVIEENHYVQILLLMHPPKDWDIPTYLSSYSELLKPEVEAGRMPAITYASFYDNIKEKILREPQLYGTNQQFDPETMKILPPMIVDVEKSNKAREEIGLPALQEGEYRIAEK